MIRFISNRPLNKISACFNLQTVQSGLIYAYHLLVKFVFLTYKFRFWPEFVGADIQSNVRKDLVSCINPTKSEDKTCSRINKQFLLGDKSICSRLY